MISDLLMISVDARSMSPVTANVMVAPLLAYEIASRSVQSPVSQDPSEWSARVFTTGAPGSWAMITTFSYAPTSQAVPCGRVIPRWSVLTAAPVWSVQLAAGIWSSAGLPGSSAYVAVDPPSTVSAPRPALATPVWSPVEMKLAVKFTLAPAAPTRL